MLCLAWPLIICMFSIFEFHGMIAILKKCMPLSPHIALQVQCLAVAFRLFDNFALTDLRVVYDVISVWGKANSIPPDITRHHA